MQPFVFFDVGGVVIRTPFELARSLEKRRGLSSGALGLVGPFAPERDARWRDIVAGVIDEDAYWSYQAERLQPLLGLTDDDPRRQLIGLLLDGSEEDILRPGIRPTLDALKAVGVGAGILSNHMSLFHRPDIIRDVLGEFDPVVDLSYEPVRKPDPAAFRLAVEALAPGKHCIVYHVDDQEVHLAGARRAGLVPIRFDPTDPPGSFNRILETVTA